MEIFRVGVILGENFSLVGFSGWELSGGNHPGENFLGGSFSSTKNNCTKGEIVSG